MKKRIVAGGSRRTFGIDGHGRKRTQDQQASYYGRTDL